MRSADPHPHRPRGRRVELTAERAEAAANRLAEIALDPTSPEPRAWLARVKLAELDRERGRLAVEVAP